MSFAHGLVIVSGWMWVGIVLFYVIGVTRPVFSQLRADAGRILEVIFPRFFVAGVILNAIGWFAAMFWHMQVSQAGGVSVFWFAVAMVANLVAWVGVEPRLHALRERGETGKAAFKTLHAVSLLLTLLGVAAAAAAATFGLRS